MNPRPTEAARQSATARNVISLVVFIHLFFVALCLGAGVARSEMHGRLINAFGFYVQSLNLNPDFTPYHLTHGTLDDVDHRIEVLPKDADPDDAEAWVKLPDGGYRASRFLQTVSTFGEDLGLLADMEEQSGSIARDVGEHFVHERGIQPVHASSPTPLCNTGARSSTARPIPCDRHKHVFSDTMRRRPDCHGRRRGVPQQTR
ncbi:MAG: hypothetical protein R3C99_09780 [Pirellulaceae bacterium]